MGIQRVGTIERALQRVFVPLFVISGALVAAGFFFPEFVGDSLGGETWLVIALVFFGAGLGYLAVLSTGSDEQTDHWDPANLLRIQRLSLAETIRGFWAHHDNIRFGVPTLALVGFFLVQWIAEPQLIALIANIQSVLTQDLGWVLVFVMLVGVIACVYLIVGQWGDIRLGGPDATPSYTYPVYFTMFFTAGIAAGIVFWGVAEPMFHYGSPPPLFGVEAESDAAITASMTYAFFHWGFTAWSAYVILGLPIAYFVYQRGAPLRVSAILTPFLGPDNLSSPLGKLVDVLAIFATIGGIATSVALVSQQFLIGIDFQWDVVLGLEAELLFILGLTAIFVLSAQSGVHRGIRRISVLTILLFLAVGLLVFAVGPTREIVSIGADGTAGYATTYVSMSLAFGTEWIAAWTMWNWAWWLSWAPFAGLFLAALSRGRTIRTIVLTGVGATGLATIAWFFILGGAALHLQHAGITDILASIEAHPGGDAVAGFPLLEALAFSDLLIFLFLALIIGFITTSADTSTLVVAILVSSDERAPTTATIVFWGVVQGIVALIVLVTGSEELLQGAAVLTGGPFALISLIAIGGLFLGLYRHEDPGQNLLVRLYDSLRERRGLQDDDG